MIKGTAPMRLKLEWNGTGNELVLLIDELAKDGGEIGLDSLNLGHAMGWILTETMHENSELFVKRGSLELNAWIEYDLFELTGVPEGDGIIR